MLLHEGLSPNCLVACMAVKAISTYVAGNVAELFGKQTKIGKIAASAQTAINTYLGAQSVFAGLRVLVGLVLSPRLLLRLVP